MELTTLIVPGENDGEEEMERLAAWVASVDSRIPLHVTRFFPRYHMGGPPAHAGGGGVPAGGGRWETFKICVYRKLLSCAVLGPRGVLHRISSWKSLKNML